jgi:leucyl-tRNA synthetase
MASYEFRRIEKEWQQYWAEHGTFKAAEPGAKPKYYVLDMFPYPSGAGLHVGHPLGYIASDIVSRFKRHKGFNVLHPMGYDAFGLPAEQYAIQTGQHPAVTTEENIKRYREQLDNIGFSFDWSREVRTSDPAYYKWTQWVFIQLFNSWYNPATNKAEPIEQLIADFEINGSANINKAEEIVPDFSSGMWKNYSEKEKSNILLKFRLAFLSEAMVNWCAALGTVLANDEVKDGVSERGGHPVERKLMTQWSLRISAYSERLLQGLDTIDWSDSIKEAQRNWIGKSEGTSLTFEMPGHGPIEVFTTRPDTIFGVSFLTLAPEHELVSKITTPEYTEVVNAYINMAKNRSERDRMADIKNISGQFTGAYAKHPFTGEDIPVWIGDYVLAGYGTGAVMAVPAHDSRDYAFAKHFKLPILEVVSGGDLSVESYDAKEGKLVNSSFLDGLDVKGAIKKAIQEIEAKGLGNGKTNYRLRDAVFGRQRYWGEPIPVYYPNGIPAVMDEQDLPLELPDIDKFLPTETGEPPLARAKDWTYKGFPVETTTMPGWAGSSWYYLRYMDPNNTQAMASEEAITYWQQVDLYIGGSEHAVGHLLYSRFWCKFLHDIGKINFDEPFKKLVNQGMILGNSPYLKKVLVKNSEGHTRSIYISANDQSTSFEISISGKVDTYKFVENQENARLPLEIVREGNKVYRSDLLRLSDNPNVTNKIKGFPLVLPRDTQTFSALFPSLHSSEDYLEVTWEPEKMSKSKWNVVNPDDVCNDYGADTLRLYEMFLGPLQDAKPWSTQGIEGVLRFLRKLWRLFHNNPEENFVLSDETPTKAEFKTLHKTIKKATEDIENFSFNTSVSAFMVCVNELQDAKCNKRDILEPLCILVAPYAPHIAEELWKLCGHQESITFAQWPVFNPEYLVENEFNYPVSFNGKVRFNLNFALDKDTASIEKELLENEQTIKYLEGKTPKKIIVVKGRIINVVV